jgi:transposase
VYSNSSLERSVTTMAKKNTPTSPYRKREIQPDERLTVGLDTHKSTFSVAIWSQQAREIVWCASMPASAAKLAERLERHRDQIDLVVYEAGPTGFWLARDLRGRGFPITVVSPSHTPECPGDRDKSDRLDAAKLARFAAMGMVREVYIPTEEEEGVRALIRLHKDAGMMVRRKKQQIRSQLLRLGIARPGGAKAFSKAGRLALRSHALEPHERIVLDHLLDELKHFEKSKREIAAKITALAKSEPCAGKVERLCTVPGIGVLSAMIFLTELPSPERFDNARQVGKILGLAPLVRSSGETRHEMGRNLCGNVHLRTMLVEAAWRWIRLDPEARKRYDGHRRATGSKKKAIVAMARHLGIAMWKMLVTGEEYRSADAPTDKADEQPSAAANSDATPSGEDATASEPKADAPRPQEAAKDDDPPPAKRAKATTGKPQGGAKKGAKGANAKRLNSAA